MKRQLILKNIVSLILLIFSFIIINYSFSEILESKTTINYSKAIQKDPESLTNDIKRLKIRKAALQAQVDNINNRQKPNLDIFKDIASKNYLKLTGVQKKGSSSLKIEDAERYQLTFTGRITNALNALDYMENNLIFIIEALKITPNDLDTKKIDMNILVSFPE